MRGWIRGREGCRLRRRRGGIGIGRGVVVLMWGGIVSWDGGGGCVRICGPLDILDVGIVLWLRILRLLGSKKGDVGEWYLKHARHASVFNTW